MRRLLAITLVIILAIPLQSFAGVTGPAIDVDDSLIDRQVFTASNGTIVTTSIYENRLEFFVEAISESVLFQVMMDGDYPDIQIFHFGNATIRSYHALDGTPTYWELNTGDGWPVGESMSAATESNSEGTLSTVTDAIQAELRQTASLGFWGEAEDALKEMGATFGPVPATTASGWNCLLCIAAIIALIAAYAALAGCGPGVGACLWAFTIMVGTKLGVVGTCVQCAGWLESRGKPPKKKED
jgi:hypothetical protein